MANKPVPEQDPKTGRFLSGNIGGGRKKGARSKLGEAFLEDMLANWQENGAETIEVVRTEKPDQYLKVVASILPKELNIRAGEFEDLTDDELARELANISAQLAAVGVGDPEGVAGEAKEAGGVRKPAKLH